MMPERMSEYLFINKHNLKFPQTTEKITTQLKPLIQNGEEFLMLSILFDDEEDK